MRPCQGDALLERTMTPRLHSIPDFLGYFASADGSIWSCWGRGRHAGNNPDQPPHLLRPGRCGTQRSYLHVSLRHDNKLTSVRVSRAVCAAFRGPPPPGPGRIEVRHKNGNPLDNRSRNLAWATTSQNQRDRVRHGTSNRGERCGTAKLGRQQVQKIRRSIESSSTLAERYGVSARTIRDIKSRRRWAWLK